MHRMLRSGVALCLLLLLFPLTACETKRVWLEFPSFSQGHVEGLWLWRRDASGAWERLCRIPFLAHAVVGERETLTYTQECTDERGAYEFSSRVERPESSGIVRVGLWYMRWEQSGTYKVSAYGPSGESALSDTTLDL